MTSVFEMDKLSPVIPGTDLHVNSEELKGLRRSYLWLSYVRICAGGSVSNDLLGIDRPDEVQKIYEKNESCIAKRLLRIVLVSRLYHNGVILSGCSRLYAFQFPEKSSLIF